MKRNGGTLRWRTIQSSTWISTSLWRVTDQLALCGDCHYNTGIFFIAISCHKRDPPQISSLTASCSVTWLVFNLPAKHLPRTALFISNVRNRGHAQLNLFYFFTTWANLWIKRISESFGAFYGSWNASDKEGVLTSLRMSWSFAGSVRSIPCRKSASKVHFISALLL